MSRMYRTPAILLCNDPMQSSGSRQLWLQHVRCKAEGMPLTERNEDGKELMGRGNPGSALLCLRASSSRVDQISAE